MSLKSRAGDISGYSFLVVFANDNTIDAQELEFLKQLALEDQVVDASERKALAKIFDRVKPEDLADDVRVEIEAFREKYEI